MRALEDSVAATLPDLAGPLLRPGVTFDDAARETARLLRETGRPIQRPVLVTPDGRYSANPAFILRDGDALVLRDVRLAHHPERKRENRVRLSFAARLAREIAGRAVTRLEIVNGLGQTLRVKPEPERELEALLARAEAVLAGGEPDLLLGHSHCKSCDFYTHCWDRAEAARSIDVLPSVTRARSARLKAAGVRTFDELAARGEAALRHPDLAPVAPLLLAEARAWSRGQAVWIADPGLPPGRTPIWFDVEADPDGERAETPVYVWGLAIESDAPQPEAVIADLSRAGDRDAWQRFVARALEVFRAHPAAVWVHWHDSEPMWIERYLARLGAPDEFVARMHAPGAFFDLHKALDRSVRLPLRSTSIKYVADWLGFAWSNPDADAAWSTAQVHRARGTRDPAERARLLAEVARYNADDLLALRVVWRWMAERQGNPGFPRGPIDREPMDTPGSRA